MTRRTAAPAHEALHQAVSERLLAAGQRYTEGRRLLVEALAAAQGPMSMFDILDAVPDMPQSSAYRHLTVLAGYDVVHKVAANDELNFFELSDTMSGEHHHHVLCGNCGVVVDVESSPELEEALANAARLASKQTHFAIDAHRIDLMGTCPSCRTARSEP